VRAGGALADVEDRLILRADALLMKIADLSAWAGARCGRGDHADREELADPFAERVAPGDRRESLLRLGVRGRGPRRDLGIVRGLEPLVGILDEHAVVVGDVGDLSRAHELPFL